MIEIKDTYSKAIVYAPSIDNANGGSRMTKDRIVKCVVTAASLAAFALCILPLMSVRTGGPESGVLVVRGYNLMEFSAWGCVPVLAPLLLPFILYGGQPDAMRRGELLMLAVGNAVCYVHGFNAARAWLSVDYHFGMVLYPLAFWGVLALARLLDAAVKRGFPPLPEQ